MRHTDSSPPTLARLPRLEAAGWAVGLSVFFFLVYGACNWVTSRRSDVGRLGFAWEQFIPFVPAMIVPYMSIDLFFFAAPFLCRDRVGLRGHARRVGLAVLVAGACFLLLPLTTTYTRPEVAGVYGAIFAFLGGFDKPFNLVPSLHIALLVLLWVVYARRTRGAVRGIVLAWFVLIALSAVLTYQHHVVDVAAGLALGLLCLYVFPDAPGAGGGETAGRPRPRNLKAAGWYALGAAAAAGGAIAWRPWGLVLLWPAFSLAVMAAAYLGLGPGVFRKSAGRLPAPARLFLGPVRLGLFLTWVYYKRRDRAFDEVAPVCWSGGS